MAFFRQRLQQPLDDDMLRALGMNRGQALGDQQGFTAPLVAPTATRPRTVMPAPDVKGEIAPVSEGRAPASMRDMLTQPASAPPAPTPDPNAPFGSSGEVFGGGRPRRTQMRDFVADDTQYLRDLENKPRNWKDKTVDVIRGLNRNFNGIEGGMPTKRERNIETARGTVGRDLALEKQQSDAALKELVPITLENGQVVMAPARSAGTLSSQQQRIGQQADALESLKARRKTMSSVERGKLAMQIYNSGGANNPKTLAALSRELDLPADLEAKFNAGEVIPQLDNDGKLQLVNKRTKEVYDTGVTSYATTQEAGRNNRRDKNAADAMERTKVIAASGAAKLGDVPELEKTRAMLDTYADEKDAEAKELEGSDYKSDKDNAAKLRSEATQYRLHASGLSETIAKAKGGQGATAPKSTRTIDGAVKAFTKQVGRPPTPAEKAKMKAKLEQ